MDAEKDKKATNITKLKQVKNPFNSSIKDENSVFYPDNKIIVLCQIKT